MRVVIAFFLAMAPVALVHAQLEVIGDSPPPADQAALHAQGAKLQTDFNAAQAKATRKGDDKMTCDQVHSELVTTMQSPGFQQFLVQQQGALSSISASTGLTSFGVLIGMQSLLTEGAVGAGAATTTSAPAAEKKTGMFKKLGSFGQLAGAAASGLGGVGHGVGSAAGTVETVAGAAQVAGAAGTAGNTTGEVAAAANAANVLNGGNAGTAAAAGVANSAAAVSNVHAAQSAGTPHTAAAAPSYNASAYQGLSANAAQAALQVGQAAVNSPDVMRAAHLGQLADQKGCKFQMDNTLTPH